MTSRARRCALLVALACATSFGCLRAREPASSGPHHSQQPRGAPRFVDPATGAVLELGSIDVDFGRVRVADVEARQVLIRNDGPATFSVVAVRPAAGLPSAFEYANSAFNVAPGAQHVFDVRFRPAVEGLTSGALQLQVLDGDPNSLAIQLVGTGYRGESPELELAPEALYIGDVELTQPKVGHVIVANVGVDVPDTTTDNLRFDLPPEVSGRDAAEFRVDWPPAGYHAADGLAEGETADLHLTLDPSSLGDKQATLTIFTNDPARPRVQVPIYGRAVPRTACNLAVRPASLGFGSVEPGEYLTLTVTLVNHDSDPLHECQISHLDISSESDPSGAFTLVNGPLNGVSIPSGEALEIPVRFAPSSLGLYTGEIVFAVDPPTSSPMTISLSGIASTPCLMVVPREANFGTVGIECISREILFTLYDTCSSSLTIQSIDLRQGSSNEFRISNAPVFPLVILAAHRRISG